MDYQVDVAALRHDDKCRYWDDEEFCDCGAIYYEKLKQCEAKLTQVEQERDRHVKETQITFRAGQEKIGALIDRAESAEQDRDRLAAEVERYRAVLEGLDYFNLSVVKHHSPAHCKHSRKGRVHYDVRS